MPGLFGKFFAKNSPLILGSPTKSIPSFSYKSLLKVIEQASLPPANDLSSLAQWKAPYAPWVRPFQAWGPKTLDSPRVVKRNSARPAALCLCQSGQPTSTGQTNPCTSHPPCGKLGTSTWHCGSECHYKYDLHGFLFLVPSWQVTCC
jgi:hypothetical protein